MASPHWRRLPQSDIVVARESGGRTLSDPDEKTWRAAIAEEVFGEGIAGLPLYLFIEPDQFGSLATRLGVHDDPLPRFARMISSRLNWDDGGDLWKSWKREAQDWERGGKVGAPPYLDLLVLLTFAAAKMVADRDYAGHNYYDRLAELLELERTRLERLKRVFPDTVRFWESLNDWLSDCEGERGWPTARAHDRRRYIGYPLSQALMREQDRRALHAAFHHYGLQPLRRISEAEMSEVLGDWLADASSSPSSLRRLWNGDPSTGRRITEIACDELSHWGGPEASAVFAQRDARFRAGRLDWVAQLALAPLPKLELYLAARNEAAAVEGGYRLGARTDDAGRAALAGCEGRLKFEKLPSMRWPSLEPWDQISITSLFSGVIELASDTEANRIYMKTPTPTIVLEAEEDGGEYVEVLRAQLFKQNLVLAHASAGGLIEAHLARHAREGWRKFTADDLTNLPRGWVLYADVMIVSATEESASAKLDPLCARPATLLSLSGGLQLGQGTWHAASPPDILAAADFEGPFFLAFSDRGNTSADRNVLGPYIGRGIADLQQSAIAVGDYEITLSRPQQGKMRDMARAGLRLRSADTPRPAGVRDETEQRYDLAAGEGFFRLTNVLPEASATLAGCDLREPEVQTLSANPAVLVGPPMAIAAKPASFERPYRRTSRIDAERFAESCAVRGHHHWICEEAHAGDNYRTLKHQRCDTCHRDEWTRNRGIQRRQHEAARARRTPRVLSAVARYRRVGESSSDAFTLLLDALTYLASGSYDKFCTLAAAISEEEGFAWRAARTLSALGHLDLNVDERAGRLTSWRVAPSTLVQIGDETWVLAGARSNSFIERVRSRALSQGGAIEREKMDDGPERVLVRLPRGAAVGDVVSPLTEPLIIAPHFALRLARALPPLSKALEAMPLFNVGSDGVERFDVERGLWDGADHVQAGAYRVDFRGRNYGFSSDADIRAGVMHLGDVSIVKHLAAALGGQSLIHYVPETQALLVPLGATLPTLFERTAVMCSGASPRYRADAGLVEYESVPGNVATLLQNRLHS